MKRDLFDGGVRVPTIARWPGRVEAGASSDHLSGFQDMMPTFAEIAGSKIGDTDGISLVPTLTGEGEQLQHEFLYWEFLEQGGKIGVTDGKWKAVRLNTLKKKDASVQLFDLEADPGETKDIATQHPEVVVRMSEWMRGAHRE
jgi:arylsulfatase A-like enzyme